MFEITTGRVDSIGIKTVIYGVEGIGKTTLAGKFPDPLFIDIEGSTRQFDWPRRLPSPKNWQELLDEIEFVSINKPCKTLVIDTIDWAEQAEVDDLCLTNKKQSVEDFGYGKGYVMSAERMTKFLRLLETSLIEKGINVVLTAHSQIRKTELPGETGTFDHYELKLGSKTGSRTSPLVREWADMVLFCDYEIRLEKTDDPNGKKKAKGGQKRIIHTTHSAVFDAKNRFGLPKEMPMDFEGLKHLFEGQTPAKQEEPVKQVYIEHEGQVPVDVDKAINVLLDSALPSKLPAEFLRFAKEHEITLDVLRLVLYKNGNTKELEYDVTQIPAAFWPHFIKSYDKKYKALVEDAKKEVLPF